MRTSIKILFVFFITYVAIPQWEIRTNYEFVRQFASDGNKMYIGRNNGMTIYDLNTKDSVYKNSLNSDLPGNYINSFMPMPDNTILVSTNGGLAVIENGTITKDKPICSSYPDNDARDLYKDSSGAIWTFSSHKVHKYSNGVWKSYDLSDSVKYAFDLEKLYIFGDKIWALFNDNTKTDTKYYFSEKINEYIKISIISDTGIVRTFQTKEEFPYYDMFNYGAFVSLASTIKDVFLKNVNGVYVYHDSSWTMSYTFEINSLTPVESQPLITDKEGNIWCTASNYDHTIAHPICYNIKTGIVTEHLKDSEDKFIYILSILDDGTIVAYSSKFFYFRNDTGWIKNTPQDFGIPDSVYFSAPRLADGKRYVRITYSYNSSFIPGSLYCLDDENIIQPIKSNTPYYAITQFGIKKDGKGIFKGRKSKYENLYYESDSTFIELDNATGNIIVKPSNDGFVYFTGQKRKQNLGDRPYLTTWEGDSLIKIDMGFSDESGPVVEDFDIYNNLLIALGNYEYGKDSLNSFLSIYNTSTGELQKFDKSNSCLPDYYYIRNGIYLYPMDTLPTSVTVDNDMNVWIFTSQSLIKFSINEFKIHDLPMDSNNTTNKIFVRTIYFDNNNNELLGYNSYSKSYFFFDIATEKWDSISITDASFIGNYVAHKKLLDNNVWACDDLGYLYKYAGKGHFTQYNLHVNGKPNLGFRINDFSIDVNNYLHLGTDIGLLTNKTILTGVEDDGTMETENIVLMPNPTTDFIRINFPESMNNKHIEIYSILGNKILESEYKDRIDVSGLNAGVYFLKAGNKIYKFVKV
ncbi:MAG: T9SS type A sorting domain-containing protein [Bacteroidetes bacterium]|nr:MAG: T9SS type A sorting domain-containing protein [Bacteroidota bacterium]